MNSRWLRPGRERARFAARTRTLATGQLDRLVLLDRSLPYRRLDPSRRSDRLDRLGLLDRSLPYRRLDPSRRLGRLGRLGRLLPYRQWGRLGRLGRLGRSRR
jgi:hypothetical protein